MKKLVVIMLALMMVFAVTACGGGGDGSEKGGDSDAKSNVMKVGGYTAEYKGYEIVKDYDGDDAIAITWNYTNDGEEAMSFNWAFYYTLFQDGAELDHSTVFIEGTYDTLDEDINKEIQPGNSIEVKTTNKLTSLESPVTIEYQGLLTDDEGTIEIDITK